jgi:hypothetical protein
MTKNKLGIMLGVIAGVIDVIPMILQKLTWDANVSAFSLWVVSGFLIAHTNFKMKGVIKGLVISFLILLPSAILIAWKEPVSLIPICSMTFLLGSALGYLIDTYGK